MNEVLDFERAAARIARNMVWIAALGHRRPGRPAAGAGPRVSCGSGHLLGELSLAEAHGGRLGGRRSPGGFRLAVRYFLLAGGSYVILRYSSISVLAVLAGLFVLIVAVFVEAAFEIFYAGKRTLDHQDL